MGLTIHENIDQGSDEWYAMRCGMLTASTMALILTPTLKQAKNDKSRSHVFELLGQQVTSHTEPQYISNDMLRGQEEEITARSLYSERYAEVETAGFITNDKWGFSLGFSPDGLVGEDGLIECKSRMQKFQAETIITAKMPDDFALQVQTGLLVSERKWCDFISYCGGMPMFTTRVYPDEEMHKNIIEAARSFYEDVSGKKILYQERIADKNMRLIPTERRVEQEIII